MPILNYTTKVEPEKTLVEIQKKLVRAGAQAVMQEYDNGVLSAVSFRILHGEQPISFLMPARADRILKVLKKDPDVPPRYCNIEQAARISWRISKDWIEAQLALVEADQADLIEVFLGFAQDPATGKTLYRALEQNQFKQLTHQK